MIELKPFLQRFFLDNQNKLQGMYSDGHIKVDMADLFVMKNAIYFKKKGML